MKCFTDSEVDSIRDAVELLADEIWDGIVCKVLDGEPSDLYRQLCEMIAGKLLLSSMGFHDDATPDEDMIPIMDTADELAVELVEGMSLEIADPQ
jgi:hypothetical protein